uniref:Uncharacterized protein n=1 Tax=Arundo donax TaxID=35708 RepID=A0A0A8Y107_ARUDO
MIFLLLPPLTGLICFHRRSSVIRFVSSPVVHRLSSQVRESLEYF